MAGTMARLTIIEGGVDGGEGAVYEIRDLEEDMEEKKHTRRSRRQVDKEAGKIRS